MRFDLDTEIRYPTGERAGVLRQVMVDENGAVVEVAMATDNLISRTVRVPLSVLSEDPGQVLTINLTPEQIDGLPSYEEERMPAVPEGWEFPSDGGPGSDVFPATMLQPLIPVIDVPNGPENQLPLSQGTEIHCLDGRWGVVDEVLTDENSQVYAFQGRPDDIESFDRIIPTQLVQQADSGVVLLNCTLADLETYTQAITDQVEEPDM